MKYINYLLFVTFVLSTSVFAQEETTQEPIPFLPQNSEEHHKYTSINEQGLARLAFYFKVQEQGVLTIAAKSSENASINIVLHDSYNQRTQTIGTSISQPHLAKGFFIIPNEGEYIIVFRASRNPLEFLQHLQKNMSPSELGDLSEFEFEQLEEAYNQDSPLQLQQITSSFTPTTSFAGYLATDKDEDETPTKSVPLISGPGTHTIQATLDGPDGDPWDWYNIQDVNTALVSVTNETGDVALLVYNPNTLEYEWEQEDIILIGTETIVINPTDNESVIFLKVLPFYKGNEEIPYTLEVEAY